MKGDNEGSDEAMKVVDVCIEYGGLTNEWTNIQTNGHL